MHIRRHLFALGIFFFGVGLVFVTGEIGLGGVTYMNSGHGVTIGYAAFPAIVMFLLAAILLARSFAE